MTIRRFAPEECRRKREDCQPLHEIVSDCAASFICCGLIEPSARALEQDEYRLCFKNDVSDTMYDHDEFDMLDQIEAMTRGLTTKRRLEAARA